MSHLEVEIKHQANNIIKATCNMFPKCVGVGKTDEEALKNLGQNIADYISNLAGDAFKTLLLSDQYSEVILDDTEEKSKSEKRVFDLDPSLTNLTKTLYIKVKSIPVNKPKIMAKNDINSLMMSEPDDIKATVISNPDIMIGEIASNINPNDKPEGFVFGFPLSFN